MEKYTKWLIVKIVLIVVLLALAFIKDINETTISIGISMIMVLFIISFLRFRHPEMYKTDERLERLSAKAVSWSWTVSLIVVAFVYWLNYLGYIGLTADQIILGIFLVMVISIIVARIYFLRKPDVK